MQRYYYVAKFVYPGPWDELFPKSCQVCPDMWYQLRLRLRTSPQLQLHLFYLQLPHPWFWDNFFSMSLSIKLRFIFSCSHLQSSTFVPSFVSGHQHSQSVVSQHTSFKRHVAREWVTTWLVPQSSYLSFKLQADAPPFISFTILMLRAHTHASDYSGSVSLWGWRKHYLYLSTLSL